MDVTKIIRTASGDTLITRIINETISYIEIMYPFQIWNEIEGREKLNIQVLKWDYASDFKQPFRMYKTSIIAISDPTEDMKQSYENVINSERIDDYIGDTKLDEPDTKEYLMEVLENLKKKEVHQKYPYVQATQ